MFDSFDLKERFGFLPPFYNWKGGEKIMSKITVAKVKKTPEQRYSMKCDKIIGLLFQMKPIANTEEKKAFVYGTLESTLNHIKSLPTE